MSPATDHGDSGVAPAETDRLSREVLICVDWIVGDPENPLGASPYPSYRAGLDARTADAVAAIEQRTGRSVRLRETDTGRGASFTGVAVELLEPIALLGGAAEAVRAVAWGYCRIAQAMRCRPLISLGTAEYLAMDDLLVVRRGFGEGGSSSFDFGDDVVGGLGPGEGLGVVVPVLGPDVDGVGEVGCGVEAVVGEGFAGEHREPGLDEVEP